jgi:hypothetical protein
MIRVSVTESRLRSWLLVVLGILFVVPIAGCGGCWSSTSKPKTAAQKKKEAEEKKEKEKKDKKKKKKSNKPVEDFTFGRILVQPHELKKDSADLNYVKRGHWVAASQQMRANNFDVQGELRSMMADNGGLPFDIEHTDYSLLYSRPVALAKGSAKPVESLFFVPRERIDAKPPVFRNELVPQRGGFQLHPETAPITSLDEWQYLFLVLSSRQSSLKILPQLNTIAPPRDGMETDYDTDPPIRHYQVLQPAIDKRVPLPANPLAWTSIAVIVWDDLDPAKLDTPQQQAMLDWLHWGGHLVISGPNSLDRLKGSFLEEYLPASNQQSINLTQASFDELNRNWSLKIAQKPQVNRDLMLVKDIVGLELKLAPHGEFVPKTGQLVAAGRVGQGRIVVTAFSLASGAVQTWKNFDGFVNGALLQRPARKFVVNNNELNYQVTWASDELKGFRRDARINSNLRYFSRDMGFAPRDEKDDAAEPLHPYKDLALNKVTPLTVDPSPFARYNDPDLQAQPLVSTALEKGGNSERFGGYLAVPRAGVASWNDFSGSAIAARKHLTDAAGVKIPKVDFIAKLLAVYLLVLVPINWSLFRLMRRVEWAWIAAPIIAIIGAVTVVKLAQLDIGFVRYRTEIDIVELQEGYSRAHVSRFVALYTSLASGYDLTFDDPTALVQPFAVSAKYTPPIGTRGSPVHFRQDSNLHLSGLKVNSNSTNLVHAEQMQEVAGELELLGDDAAGWRIKNGTELELRDAGILRRSLNGALYGCYLAEIKPGTTVSVTFSKLVEPTAEERKDMTTEQLNAPLLEEWRQTTIFAAVNENKPVQGELRLGRFAALAGQQLRLNQGGARLIAWSPKERPGVAYAPDAPQVNGISFVLAHLARGPLPPVEIDKNVIEDVRQINPDPLKAIDATDPNAKPENDQPMPE